MAQTILIVEDNELNMKLFRDLLEAQGYGILQTRDGMQALDIARAERPDLILLEAQGYGILQTRDGMQALDIARAERPDLIVMDIQLPQVSGLEVTKWIKADDDLKHIPIIAVTAFAMKGDEEKIREGGCEAYVAKPISVNDFLATIKKFLN
jgi:two-component system cell cycle response regulator DivK